jgi:sugar phosphate isomerase/epimerase
MQTRRNFLATLGVAAVGIATRDNAAAGEILWAHRKRKRIGLQLYTVRGLMKADLPGTLAKVAAIGYKEVEFHDYFGRTPAQIREVLRRNGLDSPSTHVPFESLESGWEKTLDTVKAVGHKWVVIPSTPEERRRTLDDWKRNAALFNRAANQARSVGLRFAYHNHDVELRKLGDTRPLDVLLAGTDPSLVDFEMDLYWVVFGGGSPLDFFNRYPKRFPLLHVKDSAGPPNNRMVDVGKGKIDFRTILAQSDKAGAKHYYVEYDDSPDPIASIRSSYNYLHTLSF